MLCILIDIPLVWRVLLLLPGIPLQWLAIAAIRRQPNGSAVELRAASRTVSSERLLSGLLV